ncbi:rhomboid family intramembrane serine protease [Aerosticca soli]|uniref:GlpG protein n=1 Tax=Aerosticca soli TaxID=2010829 RepID=A0A2Z6E5A4_9GAMM|nr:rhomboid family intramembrane serine protease [Aerosticca soli]MDI3261825.1 rhomboid family intramembrane serine protease [Fulvimonas sp.]BBD79708.1 GlpG protein [Aerosticca soli]
MPSRLPPATRALLIVNILVFLLQLMWPDLVLAGALWPLDSGLFAPWQIVTNAFMHGGFDHLLFNMFALYMFGGAIEYALGTPRFVVYYFVCLIVASLLQLVVLRYFLHDAHTPTVGASGAIFGLLLAFGMLFPQEKLMLIFLPIPMPAWLFVIGYALVELLSGVTGLMPGVAHFAHLGGMLGGWVLLQYWRGRLPFKPRRRLLR